MTISEHPGKRAFLHKKTGITATGTKPATLLLLLTMPFFLWSCSISRDPGPPPRKPGLPKPYKVLGKWYQPLNQAHGFRQRGIASWYGKKFHGRKTANGETYNMYGISAAHKTLPLGTVVDVFNLNNRKKLRVRINDRGPFVAGRVIDLSYGAAKKLGILGAGTAPVTVTAIGVPKATAKGSDQPRYVPVDFTKGNFTYQVGAFKSYQNAARLKQRLSKRYQNAHVSPHDGPEGRYFRVRVGSFKTLKQAEASESILIADGFPNPILVAE